MLNTYLTMEQKRKNESMKTPKPLDPQMENNLLSFTNILQDKVSRIQTNTTNLDEAVHQLSTALDETINIVFATKTKSTQKPYITETTRAEIDKQAILWKATKLYAAKLNIPQWEFSSDNAEPI